MNKECTFCTALTSFERMSENEPREGEICSVCGLWVCHDCVVWDKCLREPDNLDIICKRCNES